MLVKRQTYTVKKKKRKSASWFISVEPRGKLWRESWEGAEMWDLQRINKTMSDMKCYLSLLIQQEGSSNRMCRHTPRCGMVSLQTTAVLRTERICYDKHCSWKLKVIETCIFCVPAQSLRILRESERINATSHGSIANKLVTCTALRFWCIHLVIATNFIFANAEFRLSAINSVELFQAEHW